MLKIVDMALFHLNYLKTTKNLNEKVMKSHISQYSTAQGFFFNFSPIPVDNKTEWKL